MGSSESSRSARGRFLLIFVGAAFAGVVAFLLLNGRPPAPPAGAGPGGGGGPTPPEADGPPSVPFTDVTQQYGVSFTPRGGVTDERRLPESGGAGCALLDYDGDGDPDLLLLGGRPWPWSEPAEDAQPSTVVLYRNDGGDLVDVTSEANLDAHFFAQGAAVGDYDGDGDDDLFITAVGGARLYRNDDGRFTDVTSEAGVGGDASDWSTSTGFLDYDRDGDLDLFVCNYVRWTPEREQAATLRVPGEGLTYAHPSNFVGTHNYLYRNDVGRFTDVSEEAGIHVIDSQTDEPLGKALAVTFVDYDRDGWLDIFVANDTVRHFLFHNRGDGGFDEVGGGRGFALNAFGATTSGMGVDFAWPYNDERLAVAVSNFADEMTELYVSQPGEDVFFTDEAVATGVAGPSRDRLTFGLLFEDMDLDGRQDLIHANGHLEPTINAAQPNQEYQQPAQLYWNAGADAPRAFVPIPEDRVGDLAKPIVGRGLASADMDGDGDLDLVFTQVDGPPLVLRNDQQLGRHWLRCRLEGPPGNPHAIGAVVELTVGGAVQRRVIMPTRSYLSQCEPVATFGLGAAEEVESLTVTWPDGTEQSVAPEGVDQVVTVQRDSESFATLANTARAQLENAEFEVAITTLQRALAVRPNSAPARRNLARACILGGQPAAAIEELDRLAKATPEPSPGLAYLRGLAAIREQRQEDAAGLFREAIALDPEEPTLHFQLALALSAIGETEEARAAFERTVELDPLHGGAHYQLAAYARKAGEQDAFRQHMLDYQRIRSVKGAADPLALEECKYTRAEAMTTDAEPPATPAEAGVASQWSVAPAASAPPLAATTVLSMDDVGAYQIVGVTTDGALVAFGFNNEGDYQEAARSEPLFDDAVERATVVVGNAIVDASVRAPDAAQAGDFPEIAVVTPSGTRVARFGAAGSFEDLTASSRLGAAQGDFAQWVDLEHDGDIDLCVGSPSGLTAWRNNGDGTFVDATEEFGLADSGPVSGLAAVDLDGVNLGVDLLLLGPDGPRLMRNEFGGSFAPDAETAARWRAAERVLADDFDNDGTPDVLLLSEDGGRLFLSSADGEQSIEGDFGPIDAATTIDVDADGWLDVAVISNTDEGPVTQVWRNVGGRFAETPETAATAGLSAAISALDLDADNDGDTDLLLVGADGAVALVANETPTDNRLAKMSVRSFEGHPSSIGVRVQVKRENFTASRWTRRELPIEIGVGTREQADAIQTLWPNGVARNEIGLELGDEPLRITIIKFRRTSSCPFLYAWADGAWEFVTDVLGTAPLNVSVARGVPMPPDPDEAVVLGPAQRLVDGDAAARLRLTTELREATYCDEVRLLAVDHPAGTRVFSRDRAAMSAVDGKQLAVGRDPLPVRTAMGSDGVDRTADLAAVDGKFARPGAVLPHPTLGYTRPLSIEFEFGDLPSSDELLLVLTGWFRFGDSSTNIAGSQRGDLEVIWPRLEVATGDGEWTVVDDMVGFPTGNTKSIVCDLSGKLPEGARRFRLTTSFEVRWDALELYRATPQDAVTVTEVEPSKADLQWHGFAALDAESIDRPQVPDLSQMSQRPPWYTALEGWCTRYGDVRALVAESDGRMAILNSGDGVTLEFPAAALPELPEGRERTLVLYNRGWIKEENPNSLPDRNVAPFPGSERVSADPRDDWQFEYNTRFVPRERFRDAAAE